MLLSFQNYIYMNFPIQFELQDNMLVLVFLALCIMQCLNGGRCTAPYQCTCPEGFTGTRCEKRKYTQ